MELIPPWDTRPAAPAVRAHFLRACRILNVPFSDQLRRAAEQLRAAQKRRDDLIVKASEAGMTRRAVAAASGLSLTRVQQIVAARKKRGRAGEPERKRRNVPSTSQPSVGRVQEMIAGRREQKS
jgi:hypothetical protein